MKVYLVRHGESEYNAKGLHQHEGVPLSKRGTEQTKTLAKRFLKIPIEIILASPHERTKQTAEAISDLISTPIAYDAIFREVKRPTITMGKSFTDPETLKIRDEMRKNVEDLDWHHSDEENFQDFKTRMLDALSLIEQQKSKSVLVVSHSETIRMLVALMMFGRDLSPSNYLSVTKFFSTTNTGITLCEFKEGKWRLITWNDHAHLG